MLRNVVLISLDALRADHVGFANASGISLTPELDAFARRCTVCENAFAAGPVTTLSMPAMFTSKFPSQLDRSDYGAMLGANTTLTERLKAKGFYTCGIHSNPFLSSMFGYDRGFDYWHDHLLFAKIRLPDKIKRRLDFVIRILTNGLDMTAAQMNRKVLPILDRKPDRMFLWLHYMDPHGPYIQGKGNAYLNRMKAQRLFGRAVRMPETVTREQRQVLISSYKEEIRYMDKHLGVLFGRMAEKGMLEDSMIIITADHGESFGERGRYSHTDMLYEELIRIPLLVYVPGRKPQRLQGLTSVVDIVPTILDGLGCLDQETAAKLEGTPIGGPAHLARQTIICEAETKPEWYGCVRDAEWKLILNRIKGTRELYHLKTDPDELQDLSSQNPDKMRALEQSADEHIRHAGSAEVSMRAESMVEDRLRDLGYL
jgi:arylsulfatase A-like enzyme